MNSKSTSVPSLLWVDLREDTNPPGLCDDLGQLCQVHFVDETHSLDINIESKQPDVICFDFDFPSDLQLETIQHTKNRFPSVPILMITEQHSEALAIWALRARVWDYLVKPVRNIDLYQRVNRLSTMRASHYTNRSRSMVLPQQDKSPIEKPAHKGHKILRTQGALNYIQHHYSEKISIATTARLCQMSSHQFSRVFKREHGLTFRDYLVNYRLGKACELLKTSPMPVGDVAFATGFSDHSHFTRMFRRQTGFSPSDYRQSFYNSEQGVQ